MIPKVPLRAPFRALVNDVRKNNERGMNAVQFLANERERELVNFFLRVMISERSKNPAQKAKNINFFNHSTIFVYPHASEQLYERPFISCER